MIQSYSKPENRARFAMDVPGYPVSMMTMEDAIKKIYAEADIFSTMNPTSFDFEYTIEPHSDTIINRIRDLRLQLTTSSDKCDFKLMPIQIQAITNTVYRSKSTMTYTSTPPHNEAGVIFKTSDSDIKSPVIMDMPGGWGKTITAVLGMIVFAIERKKDMQSTGYIAPNVHGIVDATGMIGVDPNAHKVDNKCIVFVPHHLGQHWLEHGLIAKRIVEDMTFQGEKYTVRIVQNKLSSEQQVGPNEILVVICDSSSHGIKKYLESKVYYSCVCFDEVGINDHKFNAMLQVSCSGIMYGRLIMCSSDFESWTEFGSIRKNTFFASIFHCFGLVIEMWNNTATCISASVFHEVERMYVMKECTTDLQSSIVDMAAVTYSPSFSNGERSPKKARFTSGPGARSGSGAGSGSAGSSSVSVDHLYPDDARLGDIFFDKIAEEIRSNGDPIGIRQAVLQTLSAILAARAQSSRSKKTLWTMIISSTDVMGEGGVADSGYEVFHYKEPADYRKTRVVLHGFEKKDGKSKLLCVTDKSSSSDYDPLVGMNGLNVPLDCVVSIEGENLAQRMRPLCKLSRVSLPEEERNALFVRISRR